ncbi:MAG: YdeI/OmpD-associated family protein [Kofleriaceae bacterium]|jgi:uncharacterized protein YdeI (YjbR/CyaY-like superfamily)|nr:YdeI/OmpD-associated family protein [Kofleriaceae bacterium]
MAKKPITEFAGEPLVRCADLAAWEAWLERHHRDHGAIWLCLGKKDSGLTSITYAEAVDGGLCFGWIDSQKRPLDQREWLQRFSRRKPKGPWSKINRDKVALLIAAGRMRPAGQAEVDAARADGRWDAAYDSARTAQVPADLLAALAKVPRAEAFFATLKAAPRYAILYRLMSAKRPETRVARIADFVGMLTRGEAPHLIKPKAEPAKAGPAKAGPAKAKQTPTAKVARKPIGKPLAKAAKARTPSRPGR